jgi:hypothetical protein
MYTAQPAVEEFEDPETVFANGSNDVTDNHQRVLEVRTDYPKRGRPGKAI